MTLGTGTVLYVEDDECDRVFIEGAFAKAGMREKPSSGMKFGEVVERLREK